MTNVKFAQKNTNRRYVGRSSRMAKTAANLLAQMADLERGDRIKGLREDQHLTQPAVAELVGVSLRGYQEWEAGGGISWANVKKLARVFGVEPENLMRGERRSTPDLSRALPDQLTRIENLLEALTLHVSELDERVRQMQMRQMVAAAEELARLEEEPSATAPVQSPQQQGGHV